GHLIEVRVLAAVVVAPADPVVLAVVVDGVEIRARAITGMARVDDELAAAHGLGELLERVLGVPAVEEVDRHVDRLSLDLDALLVDVDAVGVDLVELEALVLEAALEVLKDGFVVPAIVEADADGDLEPAVLEQLLIIGVFLAPAGFTRGEG